MTNHLPTVARAARTLIAVLACGALLMLTAPSLQASDHIDFPDDLLGAGKAVEHSADITDLMAWVPAPGRLALAMNLHPDADEQSHFSAAVDYRFRIRRVETDQKQHGLINPAVTSDPEVTISCRVQNGHARCATGSHVSSVPLDQISGHADDPLRLFAGLRADIFFLDFRAAGATLKSAKTAQPRLAMPLPEPENFSQTFGLSGNVLSLILVLDVEKILGRPDTLFAIACEVTRRADGRRIDRVGRPEITNMTLRAPQFKAAYNGADTFALEATEKAGYRRLIAAGVTFWDGLDNRQDWTPAALARLSGILVNDYLVVDTGQTCGVDERSYLDIERGAPDGGPTCGGRTPNADVIDTLVSVYTGGAAADRESHGDGVDGLRSPARDQFPYLPPPHSPTAAR